MKVFADYHHNTLYNSLHLLFEKRLGWELYRPIGLDWFTEGYWKIGDPYGESAHLTANQYLGFHSSYDPFKELNKNPELKSAYYHVYDPDNEIDHRAVTFEQFKETKFDIIIASYIDHIAPFRKLVEEYQPQAKLIHQMGNNWVGRIDFSQVKNLMASTAKVPVPDDVHSVFYHQEMEEFFKPGEYATFNTIKSFVNVLQGSDLELAQALEKELYEYGFEFYGASNRNGAIAPQSKVAEKMSQAQFVLHLKEGGDGFGHVIHNAFACGVPPIVKMSQYKGQLAFELMDDGATCINIDGLAPEMAAKKIREYGSYDMWCKLREGAYKRFKEVVDFDKEAKMLESFLSSLK